MLCIKNIQQLVEKNGHVIVPLPKSSWRSWYEYQAGILTRGSTLYLYLPKLYELSDCYNTIVLLNKAPHIQRRDRTGI